jgi:predicted  nucleic acid-binding Zn-ribbon protein
LNKHLSLLVALQSRDVEVLKLKTKKRDLPLQLSQLDEEFKKYNQFFAENKRKYEETAAQHKELENKLKKGIDALSKAKDRLGEVKTNKEYHAILKEIENIELKNSGIETEIICLLDEIDDRRKSLQEAEKEKEKYERQYESERQQIEKEIDSLEEKIFVCTQQCQKLIENIPKDLIKRYEMIKALNSGTAVVSAWKGVCGGCHMNIPPQLYNELQKSNDLISCPNCSRIIYWQNQEESIT